MKIKEAIRNSKWGGRIINSYLYVFIRDYKKIRIVLSVFKKKKTRYLISDMINEHRFHKTPYNEYFLFNFDKISPPEVRAKFVNDNERRHFSELMNLSKNDHIFYDKENTYNLFKKYYLRDVIRINKNCSISEFKKFAIKHPCFICKPIDGGCGTGIQIVNTSNLSSFEKLYNSLIEEYEEKCIAEELIEQVGILKELHPSSVNTLRMPTIYYPNRVDVIHPFLRVGQRGNITDNAGSGGIICPVDSNGIVVAAADEFGNSFTIHPDSKKELIGFKVPMWNEAVELVKELALYVPTNKYCSWDLALTEKGWILVEANAKGQFIWQYATHIGFRDELNSILKELRLDKNEIV